MSHECMRRALFSRFEPAARERKPMCSSTESRISIPLSVRPGAFLWAVVLVAPAVCFSQNTSQLDFAVYATGSGCGAVTISGNAYIDSFDSSQGTYAQTKQFSKGVVGATGNITLSGSATINGPVFALNTATGGCANGAPGISVSGQAKVTGGYYQLGAAPPFPNPAAVVPGSKNFSFSSNSSLAPGNYGNITVSGGKTLTLSPGTYNINSLSLSGGANLTVSPAGKVIINIAGNNFAQPLNFAGGGIVNPSGLPLNFQIVYGGTSSLNIAGGASSYALLYAPNSPVTLSGGGAWFGAMTVKTLSDSGGSPIHYDRSLAVLPAIVPAITPFPNAAGWNNSNVTVSFTCSDPILGIASCPPPVAVSAEGTNQSISGTAVNRAGFAASATAVVNIDQHPPVIIAMASPPPNPAGWNNSNVTVSFTCSDALSGVALCPAPVVVGSEGASQVVTGMAVDVAGNAAMTSVTLNIDKTPPSITASISPQPDPGGYNSGPATVSFTCSDSLSGVASCPAPIQVTAGGSNPESGTATDIAGNTATANIAVNISTAYFKIQNYGGKCLDYGPPWNGTGPTVFLNDCSVANSVRVEEFNTQHAVVLHAGSQVIGIHTVQTISQGGPPAPPPAQYSLELQNYDPILATTANQVFWLDGDSIILASNRACLSPGSTIPCSPPLPELVLQLQNARGANGSPLVVGQRNLADSEFWDFNAIDNSAKYPTGGFMAVATNYDLWNAVCSNPAASATSVPTTVCQTPGLYGTPGSVIVVSNDPNECTGHSGVGPCIDLSGYPPVLLPAGVTLRGNRRGTNFGTQLYFSYNDADYSTTRPRGAAGNNHGDFPMLDVIGDYVRITAFRLRGQSRDLSESEPYTVAVVVDALPVDTTVSDGLAKTTNYIAIIDHDDISDWGSCGLNVYGPHVLENSTDSCDEEVLGATANTCSYQVVDPTTVTSDNPDPQPTIPIVSDPATLTNVRIERNFLHNNERWGGGYGANQTDGGRSVIVGNTFLQNRHSIASDGEPHSEYRAWYNFVLSDTPFYNGFECGSFSCIGHQQDFDMHGTGSGGYGYMGGYSVDIAGNTFLDGSYYNFELRGHPVSTDYFRDNVTVLSQDSNGGGVINFFKIGDPGVVLCLGSDGPQTPLSPAPDAAAGNVYWNANPSLGCAIGASAVFDYSNQFANSNPPFSDPTVQLGVGDFDNDGHDDLFLATGVAWYYSSSGSTEWRFLSAKSDTIGQLLFGDFDGDGRTDVVAIHNGQLVVSWGGISDWEVLNSNPMPANVGIADMFAGKFLQHPQGDKSYDIFAADGQTPGTWYLSYGGSGAFNPAQNSSFRVSDLRFGDFNGDSYTDVFSVQGNGWNVSYATPGATPPLAGWQGWPTPASPGKLTNTVNGLFVGDFLGTGSATVAMPCDITQGFLPGNWCIAEGAPAIWQPYDIGLASLGLLPAINLAAVGRFAGQSQLDLLVWNGKDLWFSAGGLSAITSWSSQEMR
jgi:hypothetical protein